MEQKLTINATDSIAISGGLVLSIHGILTNLASKDAGGVYGAILTEFERQIQEHYKFVGSVTQKTEPPTDAEKIP